MVRNCSVLFVALFSAIAFKQYRLDFDLPQVVGILMVIVGLLGICVTSMMLDGEQDSAPNNVLGIVMVIVGSAFSSIVFVMEEVVFRKSSLQGLHAVGSEGFWGTLLYVFIIFTLDVGLTPSDEPSYDSPPGFKKIEDLSQFSYEMGQNWRLPLYLVLYVLSISFYALSSLEITNQVSAVARSMFDSAKTLLVWLFSLLFGWEKPDALGTPLKLVCYVVVVIGTLIYNRVVHWVPNIRVTNKEGFQPVENNGSSDDTLTQSQLAWTQADKTRTEPTDTRGWE